MTKIENELVNEYEKLKKDIFLEKNDANRDKKYEEPKTIDSREVAEMMEIEHSNLIKKIDGINEDFRKVKIDFSKYWKESSYQVVGQTRNYRCFLITKRGCEFLAHKTTGTKGNLFTDRYMDRFEEMEEKLKQPKLPQNPMQILELMFQADKEQDRKIETVEKKVDELEENLPLLGIDCEELTKEVKKIGVKCLGYDTPAYKDKSLRGKVYSDIYGQIKREFGVNSYKALKRKQLDIAIDFVKNYELPMILADEIKAMNSQVVLEV